jgi:hypothetical protein
MLAINTLSIESNKYTTTDFYRANQGLLMVAIIPESRRMLKGTDWKIYLILSRLRNIFGMYLKMKFRIWDYFWQKSS